MKLTKRSISLYFWLINSLILAVGFIFGGWAAFRQPFQDTNKTIPAFPVQIIDSQYVRSIDTKFWLKQGASERYLEAKVQKEQAFLAIRVFENNTYIGTLEGKGIYTLQSTADSIGILQFKRLLD